MQTLTSLNCFYELAKGEREGRRAKSRRTIPFTSLGPSDPNIRCRIIRIKLTVFFGLIKRRPSPQITCYQLLLLLDEQFFLLKETFLLGNMISFLFTLHKVAAGLKFHNYLSDMRK
jgi:hypothetical protein